MFIQNLALPFDYTFGVPMIIFWIVVFVLCLMLLDAGVMNEKVRNVIYLVTLVLAGVVLGGIPNAVMPIQQFITTIGVRSGISYLFLAILILSFLLGTSLIVGRIFCGFLCPLGALQELFSKIDFKSDLKAQEEVKYSIGVSSNVSSRVRWLFFGILVV
ncbi:MAG: 4Fe-4S binding protein [Candidatus Hodarchaeota archaeon]